MTQKVSHYGISAVVPAVACLLLTSIGAVALGGGNPEYDEPARASGDTERVTAGKEKAEGFTFVAERGSLSDFWTSEVTPLTRHVWVVGSEHGESLVIASGHSLIAINGDGRDPSLARIDGATGAEFLRFMAELFSMAPAHGAANEHDVGENPCGQCKNQSCCNDQCGEHGSPAWCTCTAVQTCKDNGGVCSLNPVTCDIECCGTGIEPE